MDSSYKQQLKAFDQFMSKSDGKDKLCSTIQYACLFICAGKPGNIKRIQANITAARKVFRIWKPFQSLLPLITKPGFSEDASFLYQILDKVKAVCMAGYFLFDHVVWMGHVSLVSNQKLLNRCQKISLNGWLIGSLSIVAQKCMHLAELIKQMRQSLDEQALPRDRARIKDQVKTEIIAAIHACLQACVAIGLLQYAPFRARYIGLIGMLTSALNCYMLFPSPVAIDAEGEEKKTN